MATTNGLKKPQFFYCDICDFISCIKKDYDRHVKTQKHIRNTFATCPQQIATKTPLRCENCDKQYKDRTGLWRHKKTCQITQETNKTNDTEKNDKLLEYLLQENKEIKELILEIVKNGTHNTINNSHITTNNNSNNKAFNLQFFLNETCKNAMNITEFVDSIKLQLSDFMSIGEIGFVEGISNIIVKNLNSLDETVRPIHCTDQKRETFYMKDQNIWEKDDDDKKRLKKMIKSIAYKNEKLMKTYKDTYPDYNNPESKRSDQYSKIMIEAMDCKEESREKIIKNISKVTTIKDKK